MRRADGKLFELLADDVCRDLLQRLLRHDEPLTQRALTAESGLNSSTVSRRMGTLESAGIVARHSPHAPYELLFPSLTRQLLLAGADLAHGALARQAEQAAADARALRKESMDGGVLRDMAKEKR